MFTGFASENTPAIKVWDFSKSWASSTATRSVALEDDCAPIQLFKTGGGVITIDVFFPSAPPEGKVITIVNMLIGSFRVSLAVRFPDATVYGTAVNPRYIGAGQTATFFYSKDLVESSTSYSSGWASLDCMGVTAVNRNSTVLGSSNSNTSGQLSAIVGGNNHTVTSTYGGIFAGNNNTASGSYAPVIGGTTNTANGQSSCLVGGEYGTTRLIDGGFVTPASRAPVTYTVGASQISTLVLGRQTTNATATRLTSNVSSASTTNQVTLPNNSAYTFQGTVIANVTGGGDTSAWKFEGAIKRGASAATTALVAAVTPTVIAQDAGAAAWVVAVTADTANGCLNVTVTGAAATIIRWVCQIETTEVTY